MNSSRSPSIDSTEIDTENKALTSSNMAPPQWEAEFQMAQRGIAAGRQTMSERDRAQSPRLRVKVDHL
jgi:hypothetical protein